MKFLTLALLTFSITANAATTGTLLLKGTVGEALSISVDPETVAVNLPLDTSQNDLLVAQVTESSNSTTGYKISIESSNLGFLKRTGGSETFQYTMKYNNQPVNLSTVTEFTNSTSSLSTVVRDVTVSYTGQPSETMVAGEYVDNVIFTISVN